jgi:tetratricopeptide (TPR) repeat protein
LTREGAAIFPIAGILFFLITFAPRILIPLGVGSIQISLGLIQFSIDLRQLAPHGLWIGFMLFLIWAVGRWATPRARFWKELETRGIRVVWDGEERDFRERLDEAMGFSLGRGPSERILPYYVSRPEEENVLRILEEKVWTRPKVGYGVVIAGPPVAGKTRTAMELMIRLNLPFVLVWPRDKKEGTPFFLGKVALPVRRAVVLADDLSLSPGGEGPSIPKELMAFLSACPGLALIATAREDRIPPDVRGVAVVRLREMNWNADLEALARAVAQAEQAEDPDEVRSRFTGHPGSLAAGLKRFEQRYAELSEEIGRVLGVQEKARRDRLGEIGRRFLQAARALWDLGVRTLTLERIWAVVEKAGGVTVAAADRSDVQSALEKLSFLRAEQEKRLEVLRFYEGILTEVIRPRKEWEETAWETLRERRDAEAFVEIGRKWSEEYSPAYQANPSEALKKAIKAYEEAMRFWTSNVDPRRYAEIQNNLGIVYIYLSRYENPVENLQKSIAAFEQALHFRAPDAAPLEYAETQNNLGFAYTELAEHKPQESLQRAIIAYKEALQFLNSEQDPLNYGRTKSNMGLVYWFLAKRVKSSRENLQHAIRLYKEALSLLTPKRFPSDYATTMNRLGVAYRNLAEHENPQENLRLAIAAYEEALKFWTPEVAPMRYATVQNNLAVAYRKLAAHEDPVRNFRQAIAACEKALHFWTPERASHLYARAQYNLGEVYRELAAYDDAVNNLKQAIEAYKKALQFWTMERTPLNYALIQHGLGVTYRTLAKYEDVVENLEHAFQAFQEALRFRIAEQVGLDYAETQYELGLTYRWRADLQTDPAQRCADLEAAVQAFREALRFRTLEATPRWHEETRKALEEAEEALRQAGCPKSG